MVRLISMMNSSLEQLDLVSRLTIHSSFLQPQEVIMERLKTALTNKHVDIIAHPTGRVIGRREVTK